MARAASAAEERVLIVNADDLGLSDGVTAGIVRAWQEGVVTSASAMINIEGAAERVAQVHKAHPELPIGLHITITAGRPVLPPEQVPTLVDRDGRFYSVEEIPRHLLSMSMDELRAELRAQAERLTAVGVRLSHLDYHHHMVVLYTPFFRAVCELAQAYRVPVRQPVPASITGAVRFPSASKGAALRQMAVFGLRHPIMAVRLARHMTPAAVRRQPALLEEYGVPAPDWFIDGFYGNASVENFITVLEQLPKGISEVAVHPGLADDELRSRGGGYADLREQELAVLVDPRVREACTARRVRLASYAVFEELGFASERRRTLNSDR